MRKDLTTGRVVFENKRVFEISLAERATTDFLIIEPDINEREKMRMALLNNNFMNMSHTNSHMQGLTTLLSRNFTHIIFSATDTNMPVKEFISKALNIAPDIIALPASFNPNADEVFELLQLGARGFLIKPFTTETLDMGVLMATKGDRLSDAVLQARDRNEAFSALIAANLDKLATALRQAKKFDTPDKEIQRLKNNLRNAMQVGKLFAKDGEEALALRMTEFFVELSGGPASNLGRLRRRLKKQRKSHQGKKEEDSELPGTP